MIGVPLDKDVRWDPLKSAWLKAIRGIGFEEAEALIVNGDYLAVVDHWNTEKYPNQRVFVVNINDYAYYVPFVETETEIFLKTVVPSRKATRLYLRGN